MMVEILGCLIGFGVGFVFARDKYLETWSPVGRLLVYKTAKGEYKLGRLAQRLSENDDMAIVDTVNETTQRFLPFVIGRDNIRFYTNNGEAINETNWKELN